MKILLIGQLPVEAGGGYTDGVCNVVYELGKCVTQDLEVVIYATNMKDHSSYMLNDNCLCRGSRLRPLTILSDFIMHPIQNVKCFWFYNQKCFTSSFRNFAYQDNIMRLINEEKPDVVHCMNLIQLAAAYFSIKRINNKIPLILTLHGVDRSINSYTHNVIPLADKITGLTEETMEGIATHGVSEDKMIMIPNGTDTNKFFFDEETRLEIRKKLDVDEDTTIMLTVASLSQRKGQYDFLSNLSNMPDNFKFKYLILGIGPDEAKIKSYIKDNGLSNKVLLVGYVSNNELYKYYSAADVYVHSSYSEGQALSEVEAYATDLKIAVNRAVLRTIVTNTNNKDDYFIFDMNNMPYSEFVKWSSEHKKYRKTRKLYDWKEVFQQYSDMYRIICEK